MIYYYILPTRIVYETDSEGNEIDKIWSVEPSVNLSTWVGDCADNENYLIKTDTEIPDLIALSEEEFDEAVQAIGLDPNRARLWNGGW